MNPACLHARKSAQIGVKMKKKPMILSILTVLCVIVTVFLWFAMNNQELEYEEVKATVVSSKSGYRTIAGSRQIYYEVKVEYEGETYDLKNVHGSAAYMPGRDVTAYAANGNLYANVEGVNTSTPVAITYFVFLFGSIIMFAITVTTISKSRQKNKAKAN